MLCSSGHDRRRVSASAVAASAGVIDMNSSPRGPTSLVWGPSWSRTRTGVPVDLAVSFLSALPSSATVQPAMRPLVSRSDPPGRADCAIFSQSAMF